MCSPFPPSQDEWSAPRSLQSCFRSHPRRPPASRSARSLGPRKSAPRRVQRAPRDGGKACPTMKRPTSVIPNPVADLAPGTASPPASNPPKPARHPGGAGAEGDAPSSPAPPTCCSAPPPRAPGHGPSPLLPSGTRSPGRRRGVGGAPSLPSCQLRSSRVKEAAQGRRRPTEEAPAAAPLERRPTRLTRAPGQQRPPPSPGDSEPAGGAGQVERSLAETGKGRPVRAETEAAGARPGTPQAAAAVFSARR